MPKARLYESHDRLLTFLQSRRQSWDTGELQEALNLSRHALNRLGKDLAENDRIDLVRTE